uniref:Secreted protein n=1 Tax=Oryza brachyantha TaxID=4533 RepID=J3KWL7_ORYBR
MKVVLWTIFLSNIVPLRNTCMQLVFLKMVCHTSRSHFSIHRTGSFRDHLGCVWFVDEVGWVGSIPSLQDRLVPFFCLVERIDWTIFSVWLEE